SATPSIAVAGPLIPSSRMPQDEPTKQTAETALEPSLSPSLVKASDDSTPDATGNAKDAETAKTQMPVERTRPTQRRKRRIATKDERSMQASSAAGVGFLERLILVLPKIKTKIQLTVFALIVVAIVATRLARPDNVPAQIAGGAVGLVILFFSQLPELVKNAPEDRRVKLVISLFSIACIFVLGLAALTVYLLLDEHHADARSSEKLGYLDPLTKLNPVAIIVPAEV